MSQRRVPLVPDQIYHIFNRSTAHLIIFPDDEDFKRAIETLNYYCYSKPAIRYSDYRRRSRVQKAKIISDLQTTTLLVEIQMFCLMPTHFHFLIRELVPNGTIEFLTNFQNSYAKYFNEKYQGHGSVFQNRFKNVLITSDEQYIQVQKYIYLNPLEAGLIKHEDDLKFYPWFYKHTS